MRAALTISMAALLSSCASPVTGEWRYEEHVSGTTVVMTLSMTEEGTAAVSQMFGELGLADDELAGFHYDGDWESVGNDTYALSLRCSHLTNLDGSCADLPSQDHDFECTLVDDTLECRDDYLWVLQREP